jgi:hypothetical protein
MLTSLTVAATDAMVWTLVEPGVAIVAASLATIRPFLRKLRIKGFESSGRCSSGRSDSKGGCRPKLSGNTTFCTEEVHLGVVEPDHKTKPRLKSSALSITLIDLNSSQQDIRNHIQSEPFAATPTELTPPWETRIYSPSTRSFEQIHDLEAQTQEAKLG